jgi:phospholipase D1/2
VSPLSFIKGVSASICEDSIQKRVGDNTYYGSFKEHRVCCEHVKLCNLKRWFVLKDTYLVYIDFEKNSRIGFVMLCDRAFQVKKCIKVGAYHGIEIKNLQRSMILKCKSSQQQHEWYDKLEKMKNTTGNLFYNHKILSHEAFSPPRKNQKCRWFVNAEAYMENVMNGLNNAKEEIFITDWWMCPELFLKRPTDDLQYRLDKILLKKAKEGVKVYVLLFKEVEFAISLLSSRTKNVLTQGGKNPNIKVLRHPEHSPAGVMLWSHHEKLVIIDQVFIIFELDLSVTHSMHLLMKFINYLSKMINSYELII